MCIRDRDSVQTMHGYLNVALFGLDNRSSGKYDGGNSDCIMIASLNSVSYTHLDVYKRQM